MEVVKCKNLSFSYGDDSIFRDVSFSLDSKDVLLVTGPVGSGKSTLLRMLKPELMPRGQYGGNVALLGHKMLVNGEKREAFDQKESARLVAYIGQDPYTNLVCNTVRNELAFLPENIGVDPSSIRLLMSEVVYFLGITHLLDKDCAALSGGEAQIVALASVLMAHPHLLLLDEPTSQLDNSFQHQFISLIKQLKDVFDMGVVVATHTSEEWEDLSPQRLAVGKLPQTPSPFEQLLVEHDRYLDSVEAIAEISRPEPLLEAKHIYASYEKNHEWILRGASIELQQGTICALIGANGCGKSTLLHVLSQKIRYHKGKLKVKKGSTLALVPQDPRLFITENTVYEELLSEIRWGRCTKKDVEAIVGEYSFEHFKNIHPYDLSLGELQLLVFMKMELRQPDILLLDEPTKSLDPVSASKILVALQKLSRKGVSICFASHDLEAVNCIADRIFIMFDGQTQGLKSVEEWKSSQVIWAPLNQSLLYSALMQEYGRLIQKG